MTTAWDWVANVDTSYKIFTVKVSAILKVQKAANTANQYVPIAGHSGSLSLLQIEEMNPLQYGGYLPSKSKTPNALSNQLLTPQCAGGADAGDACNKSCTCQWQKNQSTAGIVESGEAGIETGSSSFARGHHGASSIPS
jgi:hypothetical protein